MGVVHSGHFWRLGSIVSLATETTGGEILVAFWPKHGLRNNFRVPNLKKCFPGGPCPQTPLAYSRTQWPYQSTIAGSSPVTYHGINLCFASITDL